MKRRKKRSGKKRSGKKETPPSPPAQCLLCEADWVPEKPCPHCGAQLLPPAPRLRVAGTIRDLSPLADGTRRFEVELTDGVVLTAELNEQTRQLHAATGASELARGQAVELVGDAVRTFDAQVGGPREPAKPVQLLRASLLAAGLGAAEVMEAALAEVAGDREPPASIPPGLQVSWDERVSGRSRLVIDYRRQALGDVVGEVLVGLLGCVAVSYGIFFFFLWSSVGSAPVIVATLYALPPLLAVVYAYLFRRVSGWRVILDAQTLGVRRAPLPWFGGWRSSAGAVQDVDCGCDGPEHTSSASREDRLQVTLQSGERRVLIPQLTQQQASFVQELLKRALVEGARSYSGWAELRPGWRKVLLPVLGVLTSGLGFFFFVLVMVVPLGSLTCQPSALKWGLARAERCPLITERLGKNISWAVGCNATREEYGRIDLQIVGDRGRGELSAVDDGFVRVTIDGDLYDAVKCRLLRKKRPRPPMRRRQR